MPEISVPDRWFTTVATAYASLQLAGTNSDYVDQRSIVNIILPEFEQSSVDVGLI